MTIVAILGLIGNSISLTILFRKKIRSVAFNQLLAVLCIVDTIFLMCNSLSCGHALGIDNGKKCLYNFPSIVFDYSLISEILAKIREYMDVFAHVSLCASVLMIVSLTCERHFAIRSPHAVSTTT